MLFVDPDLAQECVAAAAAKVRVVDFFYTDPDVALVEIVHRHGALACWQVGSKEEAAAALEALASRRRVCHTRQSCAP